MEQQTPLEYQPEFSVIAEGTDITAAIKKSLVEITLTDNGGATAQSDELQITLLSETLTLPAKGARLQLALGFNGLLVEKGWFVVCGVSSSGPPRKIVIYATAAPMNGEKQIGNVQSKKSRSWESITLGELVKTVAVDNGLTPRVAEALAAIKIPHLDQVSESDAALMTRLARHYNAVSKPAGGYWMFLEQGAATTASGKALGTIEINPPQCSTWSYNEGQRGAATGKQKEKGKIRARHYNDEDGTTDETELEYDGPDQDSAYTQPDEDEAINQVKAASAQAERNERKMTLTCPCRPAHLPMTAEARIVTSGFGKREDRNWLIESMVYTLGTSGMSVNFNLVVDINSKGKKGSEGGKGINYW